MKWLARLCKAVVPLGRHADSAREASSHSSTANTKGSLESSLCWQATSSNIDAESAQSASQLQFAALAFVDRLVTSK